jgi:hypothetical protein
MMKKKVYVSLPITGHPINEVMNEALRIKESLSADYDVITPFDINKDLNKPYSYYIGEDMKVLLECDLVFFAHGWAKSRGCRLESYAAVIYKKEIIFEEYTKL